MFICMHCGNTFDEPEKQYDHGTGHWDEECPNCGSEDFEEAAECSECGRVHAVDALIDGLCAECIEKKSDDILTAYQYGESRTQTVELNGMLASAFTKEQIEDLLYKVLTMTDTAAREAKRFCKDDLYDFAQFLKERDKQ